MTATTRPTPPEASASGESTAGAAGETRAAAGAASSADASAPPPGRVRLRVRATLRSLHHRNYRLFWMGQLLSLVGTWMADVGLAWLVLDLSDSSVQLGAVMTVRFAPTLLFSLFGGVLADRIPKRRILVVAQSLLLVQALALAALTSAGTITMALVFILAAVRGLADAAEMPTRQAFVVELVGPADVQNAVALNSTLFNTARIVGPAIGGVVISTLGVAACFWLNAASFLPVLVSLALMRPREFHPVARPGSGSVMRKLGEGIRYAAHTPDVALILGLVAFIGTFGYNFTVMLPLLARYEYGTGPQGLARLTSALGVGSLIAAVYAASRGRPTRRAVVAGAGGFGVLLLLVGLVPGERAGIILLAGVGLFGIFFHTTANSRLQLIVPGELRGRVMAIYITLFVGVTPIGSMLLGTLAAHGGIRLAVVEVAGACLVGIAGGLLFALRLRRRVPNPLRDEAA